MTRRVAPKVLAERPVAPCMTYRDATDAARERRDALRRELAEIDRAIAHDAALRAQRHALAQRLERAERDVDRARAKVALPLLANVRVASPCPARWDEMKGDDRARHCASCDKTVFDLSAMTSDEAETLLRAHGVATNGGMCVRFHRRADGTVMTSDCSVGVARARRRGWALAAGITAAAGLGVLAGGAYFVTSSTVMGEVEPVYVQGGIAPMPMPEPRATNVGPDPQPEVVRAEAP
ncbi:hypothetical protein [Sandaracinus amylolyticus]|uniref:hypothetical protein n=1 Tax=Sandaracinus amylolyticus TaxID=927083 RepID=UPI001F18465E|nr:hypothetical protein [Sandaracinus amylolyticus]UJR86538.1 Hypothetical protein I5071_86330 [Sandaracinus amylolyticus]